MTRGRGVSRPFAQTIGGWRSSRSFACPANLGDCGRASASASNVPRREHVVRRQDLYLRLACDARLLDPGHQALFDEGLEVLGSFPHVGYLQSFFVEGRNMKQAA